MRIYRVIGVLVALLLLAGACGNDDRDDGEAATDTTASEAAPTDGDGDEREDEQEVELERRSVTVALPWPSPPPICCIPDEAADHFGYFDDLNLDVTFEAAVGSAVPMQTLVAGRADIALASPVPGFSTLLAAGTDEVRFIGAPLVTNYDLAGVGLLYGATDDIRGPEDLEGKTIGITTGTDPTDPNYVLASGLLASVGLTDDDVDWIVIGGQTQRAQALIAGRVDFTGIGAEFLATVNDTDGLHVLELGPPADQHQGWSNGVLWWTRGDVVDDEELSDAVGRYVQGVMAVQRDLVGDFDFFVEATTVFQPTLAEQGEDALRQVWEWQRLQWMVNGGFNLQAMDEWLEVEFFGVLNPDAIGAFTLDAVSEPRFVRDAIEAIGEDTSVDHDPPQFTTRG